MPETLFIQLSRMGDCIQSTVLIASWRVRYPEDRIVVLARPAFAPIFSGNPDIDELMSYDAPSDISTVPDDPSYVWLERLKGRRFRTVVNLSHDRFSWRLAAELAPEILRGAAVGVDNKPILKDPWSIYLLSCQDFRRLNLVNLVDLFAHFSGAPSLRDAPRVVVDDERRSEVEQWICDDGATSPSSCIIGLQPGASSADRRWPAERFVELGTQLVQKHDARILVFGAADEAALAQSIADQIPRAQSFAGKTSIPQLAALLEKCTVLVSNDTGTMHLAAAVGVRVVAVFESSAYFRETGPYGSGHWIFQSGQLLEYGERSERENEELRMERIERIPAGYLGRIIDALLSTPERIPVPEFAEGRGSDVGVYRSLWSQGHVDYVPGCPTPMLPEDLCGRLQKPVWIALLDGVELNPEQAAAQALAVLEEHYLTPRRPEISEMLNGFAKDVRGAGVLVQNLSAYIETLIKKLRRDPGWSIPEDQLAKMNAREEAVRGTAAAMSVQPFIAFFNYAFVTAKGSNTLEFLRTYRRNVLFLAELLKAFEAVLQAADRRLKACAP